MTGGLDLLCGLHSLFSYRKGDRVDLMLSPSDWHVLCVTSLAPIDPPY